MCQYFLLPRKLDIFCATPVVFHFDRSLHLLIQIDQLRKATNVTRSFSLRYPVRLDLPWCMVCDGWVLFLFCSWKWMVHSAHELVFGDIVLLLLWISGWCSYNYLEPQCRKFSSISIGYETYCWSPGDKFRRVIHFT